MLLDVHSVVFFVWTEGWRKNYNIDFVTNFKKPNFLPSLDTRKNLLKLNILSKVSVSLSTAGTISNLGFRVKTNTPQ